MTAYNVVSPGAMVAGQVEDISVILSNFQALATILNGGLDNGNLAPSAAIVPSKIAGYPGLSSVFLRGDGAWAGAGGVGMVASLAVASANTDLVLPSPGAALNSFRIDAGGGSIRSISVPTLGAGARCEIQLWIGGPAVGILHGVAGGAGAQINADPGATTYLTPGYTAHFTYIPAGTWQLTGVTRSGDAPGVLGRDLTGRDITNSAAELSIWSGAGGINIPGGAMGVNRSIRVTAQGQFVHNANVNLTFRLKFGGNTYYMLTAGTSSIGASAQGWFLQFLLTNLGVTGSQSMGGFLLATNPQGTAPSVGAGNLWPDMHAGTPRGGEMHANPAIDTTIDKTLDFTVQYASANASVSWRAKNILTEII